MILFAVVVCTRLDGRVAKLVIAVFTASPFDLVRFCLSGFAFVRPICRSGLHRQFVTILLLFRVYIVVNGN